MENETFTQYRFINQKTGDVIYLLAINDEQNNHQERLQKKQQELTYMKNIPYEDIYYEECYK